MTIKDMSRAEIDRMVRAARAAQAAAIREAIRAAVRRIVAPRAGVLPNAA